MSWYMASAIKMTDIVFLYGDKQYTFKITRSETFYMARCNELPEAITQAKTLDELAKNMREVLTLVLRPIPSPTKRKLESKKP